MPLRMAGQYADDETGLFYNYFRFYDPKTGRYVENDPIGLAGGMNRWAYVGGSPLMAVDPRGQMAWLLPFLPEIMVATTGACYATGVCQHISDAFGIWMKSISQSTDTSNVATDNTCPQNCQVYIDNINYLTSLVKDRYYLLLADQHSLNSRHYNKKNKHPVHGSWMGHIEKYYEAQRNLASAIMMLPPECKQYVTAESEYWSKQTPPNQPNRPEAKEAGYPK